MEQVQKKKQPTKQEEEVTQDIPSKGESDIDQDGLDEFLDEIDDLLEENAETFVKEYQQKGGE